MRWFYRLAAIWLGFAACAASAQEDAYTIPQWIHRPDGELFGLFYPPNALQQNVEGRVVVDCAVHVNQRATCAVSEEVPLDWGFGAATIAMSRSFRFLPRTENGQPVEGQVRVPITYRLSGDYATAPASFTLDLPAWDAAPSPAAVQAVNPNPQGRGRGVLSCTINEDRTLACQISNETPAGAGFGQAALTLAPAFIVSESDFVARYRDEPFLLPINFGFEDVYEPVNRMYAGVGVWHAPPAPTEWTDRFYPEQARASGVSGEAIVTCTFLADGAPQCSVSSETPSGYEFGGAAVAFGEALLAQVGQSQFLAGDPIEVTARFGNEAPAP